MQYLNIPGVKKKVSRIFFGAASDPFLEGRNCDELLDGITSLGINAIDTARQYGCSEAVLGSWMKARGNRDELVLLSKCCHPLPDGTKRVSRAAMWEDLEESLKTLGTDYIDIYLLHRDDPDVPVSEVVDTFNEMRKKGLIGAFGGSNWTYERIREANEYARQQGLVPFAVTSPNLCLAPQVDDMFGGGCVSLSGPDKQEDRDYYQAQEMAVVSYSSIGRGLFSGRVTSDAWERAGDFLDEFAMKAYYCDENRERLRRCELLAEEKKTTVPVVAMAWVFVQKMKTFAVVGTQNAARMQMNMAALDLILSDEELKYLSCEDQ